MSFSYSILSVLCMHTDDSACELSAVFGVKPLASVVANVVFVGRKTSPVLCFQSSAVQASADIDQA